MGICNFIESRFLHKEICILLLDSEAESINYDQATASNKEYFRGVVLEVSENTVVLDIPGQGLFYVNGAFIKAFWEHPFDYYKSISASITKKMTGARR